MRSFPSGTYKYLLVHPDAIERNKERAKSGAPVAVVAIPSEDDPRRVTLHHGVDVLTLGPVWLVYSQRAPLFRARFAPSEPDVDIYAAYGTDSEVRLADEHGEALGAEPEKPAPKASTSNKDKTK